MNKLGRGPVDNTIYTKYKSSRPCGSREEDFLSFSLVQLCKTDKPLGRGHFGSGGHDLNKLDRGQVDDTT